MAKTGVPEKDATHDLKKELQTLIKTIIEESSSDNQNENVDRAIQILQTLIDLKKGGKPSSSIEPDSPGCVFPKEFYCPLFKDLMIDPVIVSTGTTFDLASIHRWLKKGNRTCPITRRLLSSPNLTPNHLVRDMISEWCKARGFVYPSPDYPPNRDRLTEADYELLLSLFKKLSSLTLTEQKEAARALRSITKRLPPFHAYFSESADSIPKLLIPLSQPEIDPDVHRDLITTLRNLSIHEPNKQIVAETTNLVPILLEALQSVTVETKSNAAAALFALSALDSNKSLIGKSGGLPPLIDLLEEGQSFVMKDVGSVIHAMCLNDENKGEAVESGAVRVVLKKIEERVHVDEMLVILAMLSSKYSAVMEMSNLGALSILFSVMKETKCERNKENCIAVVHRICFKDERKLILLQVEEGHYGTISNIAGTGSLRAKRKAEAIFNF